ncbi:MAG: hypothetical protein ACLPUG_16605 [Acidimicrobiales bacterium]
MGSPSGALRDGRMIRWRIDPERLADVSGALFCGGGPIYTLTTSVVVPVDAVLNLEPEQAI